MSRRHHPDLDLYSISEEVKDFPAVESTEMCDSGLVIETATKAFNMFYSGGPHEQRGQIPEAADRVLITVQNGFLEFQEEDILLYELGEGHGYGDVIEDSRTLSIYLFISFYALCNARLKEYAGIARQDESAAAV